MNKEIFVLLLLVGVGLSDKLQDFINEAFENEDGINTDGEPSEGTCDPGYTCIPFYLCKDQGGHGSDHGGQGTDHGSDHGGHGTDHGSDHGGHGTDQGGHGTDEGGYGDNDGNTDGTGLIDIRIDTDDEGTRKCSYLDTCCAPESKSEKPTYKPPPPSHGEGCGYRNVDGNGFKIQGAKDNEAQYGEFPWMVAILTRDPDKYICGGSLISPSVVLTAAHYVNNKDVNNLVIRAGEWDTQTKRELFVEQNRLVSEKVVHENFYKGALFNDIALLFVTKPFEIRNNVQTICLPPHGMNFDHQRCFATGWGVDVFAKPGEKQVILKKIDLPIVPNGKCQADLRKTRLGKRFELHESFLCAGGEYGKDTCKGDGGSPLVCPIPNTINRYYQTGIVAWGVGCGEEIPGVYANVAYLRPWIDGVLARKQVQNSHYTP